MKPEAPRKLGREEREALIRQNTVEIGDASLPAHPKVSVLIVTFNHVHFVTQTLESALRQNVDFPYEIVVGDDHSTDGTTEILLEFQKRHPDRIRVLLANENMGRYTGNGRFNLVRTLAACRGEYIALLEGDDYWTDPDKLQLQADYLDQNRACAFCHHRVVYVEWPEGRQIREFPARRYRVDHLDPRTFSMCNFVQTCSVVCRKDWLPPFDEEFMGLQLADWPLFALLSQRGWIGYLDRTMAHYRVHPNNNWKARSVEFQVRGLERMARYLLAMVDGSYKDGWKDLILSLAFTEVVAAIKSFSVGRLVDRLKRFVALSVEFRKPFWILNRLWPYYRANHCS